MLEAAEISGTVKVTRRLTKRRVAAVASGYHRGAAVAPAAPDDGDFTARELDRVAVYVEGAGPAGAAALELPQQNRRFATEVVVVPAGSTVSFPNLDPLFHNVFSLSSAKSFDLGNYPKGQTRNVRFDKPGIVSVHCHLHANMSAAVVVTPNRWAVKPAADGRFVIRDVPPGTYRLAVWHRSAGLFEKDASTGGGSVTITIPVDAWEPAR